MPQVPCSALLASLQEGSGWLWQGTTWRKCSSMGDKPKKPLEHLRLPCSTDPNHTVSTCTFYPLLCPREHQQGSSFVNISVFPNGPEVLDESMWLRRFPQSLLVQLSMSSTEVGSQLRAGKWEHHLILPHDRVTEGTQVSQFLQDIKDSFSLSMEPAHQHLPWHRALMNLPSCLQHTGLVEAFPGISWELKHFLLLNVVLEITFVVRDSMMQMCLKSLLEFYWVYVRKWLFWGHHKILGKTQIKHLVSPAHHESTLSVVCRGSSLSFIAVAPLWIPLQKFQPHWSMSGCYLDIPIKYIGVYLHIPITYIDIPPIPQAGGTLIRELSITQSLSLAHFRVDIAQITFPGWTSPAGLELSWSLYDSNPSS